MKAVISIGDRSYLLKSDKAAQTVMKALDGAQYVLGVHEGYGDQPTKISLYDGKRFEAGLRLLPDKTKVEVYREPLLGLPEHGTRQD